MKKIRFHYSWIFLSSVALLLSVIFRQINLVGLGLILLGAVLIYTAEAARIRPIAIVCHLLFIVLALGLASHKLPGFHNIRIFDSVKFSNDSLPFSGYLNFDKTFAGFLIFCFVQNPQNRFKLGAFVKNTSISLLFCVLFLLVPALFFGYVRFDPKLPSETWLWALTNLFLVCTTEEAFFRFYLQSKVLKIFAKFRIDQFFALVFTSVLFGLAHIAGGLIYVVLSAFAGMFYGYAFLKTRRIEAAILTHFGLNFIHFIFFSYPALIR